MCTVPKNQDTSWPLSRSKSRNAARAKSLSVGEAVGHGHSGGAKIEQRHDPLQPVVPGFVEKVAHADHPCGFACEIHCQSGRAAAENARHRVQFSAAILQVGTSHGEIGDAGCGHGGKENSILGIPEPMPAGRFRQNPRPGRRHGWGNFDRFGIEHCPALLSKGLLSKGSGAERGCE